MKIKYTITIILYLNPETLILQKLIFGNFSIIKTMLNKKFH